MLFYFYENAIDSSLYVYDLGGKVTVYYVDVFTFCYVVRLFNTDAHELLRNENNVLSVLCSLICAC